MNLLPISALSHKVLTVSELNSSTKLLLEQNIPLLWIKGEISNLKCYQSGHWYFSLKDSNAQIRCVMFSHKNQYLDWQPKDGVQIEVLALVTLYEPRGDFQLNVETMRRAGLGQLFEAFEKLKIKLGKSGLFDSANKKPPPTFPKQIGIVTSPATAALQDVLSALQRRMPFVPVILYPALVQGKTAAATIAGAIQMANRRAECDVLILCRGGGSIEDLWAFNEEIVAHAIAASNIPVISGIGHETDFTIADFAADVRAPTPTAAAEMASQDRKELSQRLGILHQRLYRVMRHRIEKAMQCADILSHRLIYPGDRIKQQSIHLQYLQDRFSTAWAHQTERKQWRLLEFSQRLIAAGPDIMNRERRQKELNARFDSAYVRYFETRAVKLRHAQTQLSHLNPQSVLARGYSITYTLQNAIVRDSKQVHHGDRIRVKFAHGACEADITKISNS